MYKPLKPAEVIDALGLYGPMIVADFGAGAGHFAIEAARRLTAGGVVWAFDVLEAPLAILRRTAEEAHLFNIKTIRADLEKPHGSYLEDASVDRIVLANILFQASDRQAIVREACRILKKGGKIVVVEWSPLGAGRVPLMQVRELLERAGCGIERELTLDNAQYGLVASKKP